MQTRTKCLGILVVGAVALVVVLGVWTCAGKSEIWPPRSGQYSEASFTIAEDTELAVGVAPDDPLKQKGVEWLGRDGRFWPDEKQHTIASGTFLTRVGDVEKRAKFTGVAFVYADMTLQEKTACGYWVTEGELILPWFLFEGQPPERRYVENRYQIEAYGQNHVLIRLRPDKGHRLCILSYHDEYPKYPTVSLVGSKAELQGVVVERKKDGWYRGKKRLSQ